MGDVPRSWRVRGAVFGRSGVPALAAGEALAERLSLPACGHDHGWELGRGVVLIECARCDKQTSMTAGTVIHRSHLPLKVWFMAAWLVATHKNGISARQLWLQLGLDSYKTAWLLLQKLRRAMVDPDRAPLAGWSMSTRPACPGAPRTRRSRPNPAVRTRAGCCSPARRDRRQGAGPSAASGDRGLLGRDAGRRLPRANARADASDRL
jgi:hypothetical protein